MELIDAIRMIHAGLLGFIEAEKAGLFTLPRSLDLSFERMLDALILLHCNQKHLNLKDYNSTN